MHRFLSKESIEGEVLFVTNCTPTPAVTAKAFVRCGMKVLLAVWLLLAPVQMFAEGWTPTDAGLVVNLKPGDRILISTMINGEEYFICHYPTASGGDFGYTTGNYLQLRKQASGATTPSPVSIWTIDEPLTRKVTNADDDQIGTNRSAPYPSSGKEMEAPLGGIAYTMWNTFDNKAYTLTTTDNVFKFLGNLSSEKDNTNLCDVVFVVPTIRASVNMNPKDSRTHWTSDFNPADRTWGTGANGTNTWAFDGKTGVGTDGFAGMIYREVYWLEIPRTNGYPKSYTNAALVTFNTDKSIKKKWNNIEVSPGRAFYAYADTKHNNTPRTLFRLYILTDPFNTCPNSYFFGWNEQSTLKYRSGPNKDASPKTRMTDSTDVRKIYTTEHLYCMSEQAGTTYFETDGMQIPSSDSAYFYVGRNNKYHNSGENMAFGFPGAKSQFTNIRRLRVRALKDAEADAGTLEGKDTIFNFTPTAGAYGKMVIDTTSSADNLGVTFEPVGYFLRTNSDLNLKMHQGSDANGIYWQTDEAWTLTDKLATFKIKATLLTDAEFSMSDPGADIRGWSKLVGMDEVSLLGGGAITDGTTGWARIYPANAAANGAMVFVTAEPNKYIVYDYNGSFGETIPDQHPATGETTVIVQAPQLLQAFNFTGWNTSADGRGTTYQPGAVVDFSSVPEVEGKRVLRLYAQTTYTGSINVAVSFMKDGERYYMTHPGRDGIRYARTRRFGDWTNVWQGMADENNTDPNYINTFKIIGKPTCIECKPYEYVLDPAHETMYGNTDSLVFYETFMPEKDEYLGLYFTAPYTVLANNTWAGLFQSSAGWPTPAQPCIDSTWLSSSHYLTGYSSGATPGSYTRNRRGGNIIVDGIPIDTAIHYIPSTNQFDAGLMEGATYFMISGVGVVDNHYVILPDTTKPFNPWVDEVTFDYHENEQIEERIWSELIGKQLLAQMTVGDEIIYFHPSPDKTISTASGLRLSLDYRLEQTFTYIPDNRGGSLDTLSAAFRATMSATDNDFSQLITSGISSPMEIKDKKGNYIDICDTLRVRLLPRPASKIKAYYGRWKTGAPGLVVDKDGSRYRDIIIRTKTYHYGEKDSTLVLTTDKSQYVLSPLAGQTQSITCKLQKQVYDWLHELRDGEHIRVSKRILSTTDVTYGNLHLTSGSCSFTSAGSSSTYFSISSVAADSIITLATQSDNLVDDRADTLIVTVPAITIAGESKTYPTFTTRIPLMQSKLEGEELIWSVMYGDNRYYITVGSGGLIFRQYRQDKSTLYQLGTSTALVKGSKDAANSDTKYITPWKYVYTNKAKQQLKLKTEYGIYQGFHMSGASAPYTGTHGDTATASSLTYEYVRMNTNDNANFEEVVYLRYGENNWLKFDGTQIVTTTDKSEASVFYWGYLLTEYSLLNYGTYPNPSSLEFNYARVSKSVQTRYKAYREYSMLIDGVLFHLGRVNQDNIATLTDATKEWKTAYAVTFKRDERFAEGASGLSIASTNASTLTTTIAVAGEAPVDRDGEYKIGGKYVNIVDTLDFAISRQDGAPTYRFKDKWSSFKSIEDAHLKIPLVCKTYHDEGYDSLVCIVADDQHSYVFPATIDPESEETVTFTLSTERWRGTHRMDIDNQIIATTDTTIRGIPTGSPLGWNLADVSRTELRLADDYGKTPTWCEISNKTANTVTIRCTANGIRTPRTATLHIAYVAMVTADTMLFANFQVQVSQPSFFQYANNQTLVHTRGASGDPLMEDGRQQVHENKRVLYYYNPSATTEADQNTELPLRERGFYGWWRWYEEGAGIEEADIPNTVWQTPPINTGKYEYPYRTIGDSVYTINPEDPTDTIERKLVTMGRYTVFHYPAVNYGDKTDPASKTPLVYPPSDKSVKRYVVDISNYYDNLPLSMSAVNQVDTAMLDTMRQIIEPTLSIREIFELRPWTEMAETMDNYKSRIPNTAAPNNGYPLKDEKYMEDHVMMAPVGNRLLLRTEQRYNYDNIKAGKHSESLLGYYMRDDNWDEWDGDEACQDTMIWCGGWDIDCEWYTYDPSTKNYTKTSHRLTTGDDFLDVPARAGITTGQDFDTVYYCLRARSWKTENPADPDSPVEGDYWFNICRYMLIYHTKDKYGPLEETSMSGTKKALMTNEEIEQTYEVLERLNFDYNKPSSSYTVYPHPLPWADGSYGYSYPVSPALPDNRYHNDFAPNFPGPGEYSIINRIVNQKYCRSMDQHGGAENGYMIYCDGMSSAGQVAALNLKTVLCEGQKMYFSAYVGNVSNQDGKANPNFHISVQGSTDGTDWVDITSYTTGDITPSNNWYQIFFPINFNIKEGSATNLTHFRVRIFNMASTFDGNDFVLDDMCLFATKPPLIAYQANSTCVEEGENDSITHVMIRVDYQGFNDDSYKGAKIFYSVDRIKDGDTTFVAPIDGYINQEIITDKTSAKVDTVYGWLQMPKPTYEPESSDSIFNNFSAMSAKFEETLAGHQRHPGDTAVFQQGYIYEHIDNTVRPVLYIIHKAKMTPDCQYVVRMSLSYRDLQSSICAMTSGLKVSNRMVLELNGEERENMENSDLCANTTYDISLRVKGLQFADNAAPLAVNGTCMSDWLPGAPTDEACLARYGYSYDVIVNVIEKILRCEPNITTNPNQFAPNLTSVNHDRMLNIQKTEGVVINGTTEPEKDSADDPYVILTHLVERGLILYQSSMTAHVTSGDSVQYIIFPIIGSGSDNVKDANVEICPEPIYCKLKPKASQATPLIIGGSMRDPLDAGKPVVIAADSATIASSGVSVLIDYISPMRKWHSIILLSTDDPYYRDGVHSLNMVADKENYSSKQTMVITPATGNNYAMRGGYNYTFGIVMQTLGGYLEDEGCPVGTIPFTIAVVPDYLRWDPQTETADKWNDPNNWIGITQQNVPIQENARFAPQTGTRVIIPTLNDGRQYPVLTDPSADGFADSIRQVGFQYNQCADIRFMPGASLGSQEMLTYTNAIVDMSTPHGKWALRAAPVKGMLSGDIFMADADLNRETSPWEIGEFDAAGRNLTTGNASFWLSFYNRTITQIGNKDQVKDSTRTAAAEWSRAANGMTESLPAGQGWAIYTKTKDGKDAAVRLPKNDDVFYYYTASGEKADESLAHKDLQSLRTTNAGGSGAGKLAFDASSFSFTISNVVKSPLFVFGNPTMAYIDIWGFIADNSAAPALIDEFDYLDEDGKYTTITKAAADGSTNVITNQKLYLPPMHAIVLKVAAADSANTKAVTLNADRVVTAPIDGRGAASAPGRNISVRSKGIMTVTAVNPADAICTSRLLIGQGYHNAVLNGEDAVLTTINVDRFSSSTPATPFNIYAAEGDQGTCIDLRDEVVNVPLSFYNSPLPFEPVSYLWFTGVNNIDGQLVLYDALTDSERLILDGICLDIETPEYSHETRYYIRLQGWSPEDPSVTTPSEPSTAVYYEQKASKIIRDGKVYILHNGHIYSIVGQKLR